MAPPPSAAVLRLIEPPLSVSPPSDRMPPPPIPADGLVLELLDTSTFVIVSVPVTRKPPPGLNELLPAKLPPVITTLPFARNPPPAPPGSVLPVKLTFVSVALLPARTPPPLLPGQVLFFTSTVSRVN